MNNKIIVTTPRLGLEKYKTDFIRPYTYKSFFGMIKWINRNPHKVMRHHIDAFYMQYHSYTGGHDLFFRLADGLRHPKKHVNTYEEMLRYISSGLSISRWVGLSEEDFYLALFKEIPEPTNDLVEVFLKEVPAHITYVIYDSLPIDFKDWGTPLAISMCHRNKVLYIFEEFAKSYLFGRDDYYKDILHLAILRCADDRLPGLRSYAICSKELMSEYMRCMLLANSQEYLELRTYSLNGPRNNQRYDEMDVCDYVEGDLEAFHRDGKEQYGFDVSITVNNRYGRFYYGEDDLYFLVDKFDALVDKIVRSFYSPDDQKRVFNTAQKFKAHFYCEKVTMCESSG